MNLPLTAVLDTKEIQKQVDKQVQKAIDTCLGSQFNDGKRGTKGESFSAIEETVNNMICSESSVAMIEKLIVENWPAMLEAATLKALEHKANRLAFARIKSAKLHLGENNG